MKPEQRRTLLRDLWLASICAVVIGSLVPPTFPVLTMMDRMHISDKVLHFGAYAVLSLLPVLVIEKVALVLASVVTMELLGIGLEFAQRLVGRTYDTHDMMANTLGLLCGSLVAVFLRNTRYRTVS